MPSTSATMAVAGPLFGVPPMVTFCCADAVPATAAIAAAITIIFAAKRILILPFLSQPVLTQRRRGQTQD